MTGLKINDIVTVEEVEGRFRIVMINWPLAYLVDQHAPKTDVGTRVHYCDQLTPCGYSIEK